jgi:hypothetical protein
MKLIVLVIILFYSCAFNLHAQNTYSVRGKVTDTSAKSKLVNASVSILSAKDSIFRKITHTSEDGSFLISNVAVGRNILLITYPDYADYVEEFTLDSANYLRDFGNINMQLKSKLLNEVVIKGRISSIKIKGDTTEFNAKAYVIEPNAKVEDLLKQLPGIQVDKDGKITAQGTIVKRVLVDGEEFFGDDPTLSTRNIRSDMVDKIQLYDKKSDQATFSGIDDGVKEKTINIKLKEDKKNGVFGKAEGGLGTGNYYEGQAIYNRFTAKQKLSAYSTIANTGKTGLKNDDNNKYGSANLDFYNDGTLLLSGTGGSELDNYNGNYDGKGIPLVRSGGVHYDGKSNDDKESVNTNYKIGSIEVKGDNDILTQQNLPVNIINTNRTQAYDNYLFRQNLDVTYQIKLDTTSNLKIIVSGTDKSTNVQSRDLTISDRGDNILLNSNNRNQHNNGDQQLLYASSLYTKKFKKPGRTLSFLLSETYSQNQFKGYLNSAIDYYGSTGMRDSTQNINQYSIFNTTGSLFSTNLTYTEPISKFIAITLNYGLSVNYNTSERKSFTKAPTGQYNVLIDSLSNKFKFDQTAEQVGVFFNYKKGKSLINWGTKIATVNFKQSNEYNSSIYKRNFFYWLPQALYKYNFSQQQTFSFTYNGNTKQPTVDQLQPVRVNTDPLNIIIGNQNLKPSFTNRIEASYTSYKELSEQFFLFRATYFLTANPIITNSVTDSAGKTTSQFINLMSKKVSNYSLSSTLTRKINSLNLNAGLYFNLNGNTFYSYINGLQNKSTSITYSGGLTFTKVVQKKYSLYGILGPTYTIATSSVQQTINANGGGFVSDIEGTIYLPWKFLLTSEASYVFTAKTGPFNEQLNRTLVNASLSRTFLKEEKLKISVSVNDLLNQNTGFDRNAYGNTIVQNSYTTIKRYFMLSLTYDFTKFKIIETH